VGFGVIFRRLIVNSLLALICGFFGSRSLGGVGERDWRVEGGIKYFGEEKLGIFGFGERDFLGGAGFVGSHSGS
jgi:hypothetical protein